MSIQSGRDLIQFLGHPAVFVNLLCLALHKEGFEWVLHPQDLSLKARLKDDHNCSLAIKVFQTSKESKEALTAQIRQRHQKCPLDMFDWVLLLKEHFKRARTELGLEEDGDHSFFESS